MATVTVTVTTHYSPGGHDGVQLAGGHFLQVRANENRRLGLRKGKRIVQFNKLKKDARFRAGRRSRRSATRWRWCPASVASARRSVSAPLAQPRRSRGGRQWRRSRSPFGSTNHQNSNKQLNLHIPFFSWNKQKINREKRNAEIV